MSIKIRISVIAFLLIILVVFADNAIKEVVSPIALKNAEIIINSEVNRTIGKLLENDDFNNSDFISVDDNIKSIITDSNLINRFKARAVTEIESALYQYANSSATVQLGNIINSSFLSNRGPNITILYDLGCSVNSEIVSEFKSAGVNQTVHIMKLKVTTDAYVAVFWEQTHKTVVTDYVICETVIVGDTPTVYGNLKSS